MSLDDLCQRLENEGFKYTDVKPKIYKSLLSHILKNPFYTGNFLYKNVLYKGNHEALISMKQFQEIQARFKKNGKPETRKKHNFLYLGLFKCACCGSAITGEIKKGKYIYYHCANKTKGCKNKGINIKEEQLDKVFEEGLKRIAITSEHKQAIITVLKDSHKEAEIFHREEVKRLTKNAQMLRNRISKIYLDKLDGLIDDKFWAEKNNEWTLEHARILQDIKAQTRASINYMQQGVKLVELLENLYTQYIQLESSEKAKLLKFIFSNFLIDGQNVHYDYNRPFDIFAKGLSCTIKWAR